MATNTYLCKNCYRYFFSPAPNARCPHCGSRNIEGIEG